MADKLFKIKPLKWHEAADGYWIASSAHYSYEVSNHCLREVEKNILVIKDSIRECFVHVSDCESISDGKAQAEQHHLDSVANDLIAVGESHE